MNPSTAIALWLLVAATVGYRVHCRLARLADLEDVPRATTAIGSTSRCFVRGRAAADESYTTPLGGDTALVFRSTVEVQRLSLPVSNLDDWPWTPVQSRSQTARLRLRDDWGELRLDAAGADIDATRAVDETVDKTSTAFEEFTPRSATDRRRRYRESVIGPGDEITAFGRIDNPDDSRHPARLVADVVSTRLPEEIVSDRRASFYWNHVALLVGTPLLAWYLADTTSPAGRLDWIGPPEGLLVGAAAAWIISLLIRKVRLVGRLTRLENHVDEAWDAMCQSVRRRARLLADLEQLDASIPDDVARRGQAGAPSATVGDDFPDSDRVDDLVEAVDDQTETLRHYLYELRESPNVTDTDDYRRLAEQLVDCEERLSLRRDHFNRTATLYDERISDGRLIALVFGHDKLERTIDPPSFPEIPGLDDHDVNDGAEVIPGRDDE